MSKEIERKHLHFEIKEVAEDGTFSGYGSVFGAVDSYNDVVVKGAFKRTIDLRGSKVRLLWQHQSDKPIGKFTSFAEDEHGLRFTGKLNLNVQQGREAYEHLKHGDIDGMSIGFTTTQEEFDSKSGIRYIKEVKLYEISLVTFPACEEATVQSVKELRSAFDSLTQEQRLEALAFINKFHKSLPSEDSPISEASDEKHSSAEGLDAEGSNDPQEDQELLHSLEQLKKSMTLIH